MHYTQVLKKLITVKRISQYLHCGNLARKVIDHTLKSWQWWNIYFNIDILGILQGKGHSFAQHSFGQYPHTYVPLSKCSLSHFFCANVYRIENLFHNQNIAFHLKWTLDEQRIMSIELDVMYSNRQTNGSPYEEIGTSSSKSVMTVIPLSLTCTPYMQECLSKFEKDALNAEG